MSVNEYETTISINIKKSDFDNSNPILKDVVIFFNDNKRLSERKVQIKTTSSKKNILSIQNNIKYPLVRTESLEILSNIGSIHATTVIFRKILSCGIIKEKDGNFMFSDFSNDYYKKPNEVCNFIGKFRLSLNHHINNAGDKYICSAEVEYGNDGDILYDKVCSIEKKLIELIENWSTYIEFENLNKTDIFSVASPKIQMFTAANLEEPYQWAYKWNGIKAKFLYTNNVIYLWKDVHDLQTIIFQHEKLDILKKLCLQVEVMETKIIIVEIIASKYNEKIYYIEPHTNLEFLEKLYKHLKNENIFIDGKKLYVQRFYKKKLPEQYDEDEHDGFLINQNHKLIKWKFPTIDVQYLKKENFSIGSNRIIKNIKIDQKLKQNSIYEVCFDFNEKSLRILRERNDRVAPSSDLEFEAFNKCITFLNKTI